MRSVRSRRSFIQSGTLFVASTAFFGIAPRSAWAAPARLLEDLQAAHNGEANAQAKYVAFAGKADQEGFAGVASLFRVLARGEEIHTKEHAELIRKLGGTPAAAVKPVPLGTTAENLKAAIEAESYDRDKMYPAFVADALAAGNKDAIKDFKAAVGVEAEHAKLLAQAASNLGSWKTRRKFLVCPTCGLAVLAIDFEKCPICFTEAGEFFEMS